MAPEYSQIQDVPLTTSREKCSGKTYVVTGANVGLGLEACRHLVIVGAEKVIMGVRNVKAGQEAAKEIEESTGIKSVVEVWALDLSSFASVQEFARRASDLPRIDALIENAGVASPGEKVESRHAPITVNVTSTFYLAFLLLPKLRESGKTSSTRLTSITSNTALGLEKYWAAVAEDPIERMDNDADLLGQIYPGSKLLEILGVQHLSKLLPVKESNVIINTANPGICVTSLSRNAPQAFKDHLKELWDKMGRTAEQGSRTLLAGAVAGEDSHGSYMDDCVPAIEKLPPWMNEKAQEQAWNSIVKEVNKIDKDAVTNALQTN